MNFKMPFLENKTLRKMSKVLFILIISECILLLFSLLLFPNLKGFIEEIAANFYDQQRITDINNIQTAIDNLEQGVVINNKINDTNTVFISIPSNYQNCSDIKLPELPIGWGYHCSNEQDYKATNGSGWIPLNLQQNSHVSLQELPIHPINSEEGLNYFGIVFSDTVPYTFYIGNGGEIIAYLEAVRLNTIGEDPNLYVADRNAAITKINQGLSGAGNWLSKIKVSKAEGENSSPTIDKIVFISIPDKNVKCVSNNLPYLPKGFEYRCVNQNNLTNIDGSGWLPIDFSTDLLNRPFRTLPIQQTGGISHAIAFTMGVDGKYQAFTLEAALSQVTQRVLAEKANDINSQITTNFNLIVDTLAQNQGFLTENLPENENVIYISLPSVNSTCDDLIEDLPALQGGWSYRCQTTENYRNANGRGWLPIDLSAQMKELPIDPENSVKNGTYYAYIKQRASSLSPSEYMISANLKSNTKIQNEGLNDSGTEQSKFELGTNPKLYGKANGLEIWLPFNTKLIEGNQVADLSGNNINATFYGNAAWKENKCIVLDGENSYIEINKSSVYSKIRNQIKINYFPDSQGTILSSLTKNPGGSGHNGYYVSLDNTGKLTVNYLSGANGATLVLSAKLTETKEYSIEFIISEAEGELYLDGKLVDKQKLTAYNHFPTTGNITSIGRYNYLPDLLPYFKGEVCELKIYSVVP